MSELIAVAYDNESTAREVMEDLLQMEAMHLVDLEDAAYVTKSKRGKVRLHQTTTMGPRTGPLAAAGAFGGGMLGLLIGLVFFVPVLGLLVGLAGGALAGATGDEELTRASRMGLDPDFVKRLSDRLTPGTSALFILVLQAQPARLLEELGRYGGTVLRTSLSPQLEEAVRAELARHRGEAGVADPEAGM